MKNNTIAIALGALLVGGVATAGFMNNRAGVAPPAPDVNGPAAGAAAASTAANTVGSNAGNPQASSGLSYAPVTHVQPVLESEPLYAAVIGVDPVRESSTTNIPQQVCNDVVVSDRMPERDGNVGGTVAGALIGAAVGNQVGGGNGRKAATLGGAVAGGFIGNRVDRNHVGGQVVQRTERQCRTVNTSSTQSRTVGWDVRYRNADGSTGSMRTQSKPGERILLGQGQRTVGYDVTYEVDGRMQTVRMAQPPGERVPLIDGHAVVAAVPGVSNR